MVGVSVVVIYDHVLNYSTISHHRRPTRDELLTVIWKCARAASSTFFLFSALASLPRRHLPLSTTGAGYLFLAMKISPVDICVHVISLSVFLTNIREPRYTILCIAIEAVIILACVHN